MDARADGRHKTLVSIHGRRGQAAGSHPSITAASESCVDGGDPVHVAVAVKVHVTVDDNVRPFPGRREQPYFRQAN